MKNTIIFLLLFVFYNTYSFQDVKERLAFHLKQYYNFIILFILGIVVFIPQMMYWHALTGKFVFYSYQNETFSNWKSPKILEVIAGPKSGWLIYCPIMILSLIGLIMAWRKKAVNAKVTTFIFLCLLYVCSSWWAYTFGAAYGSSSAEYRGGVRAC